METSRILGLVYKAQLEREHQVSKGYDAAHDAGHTPAEWAALAQRYLDQLRERTEWELEVRNRNISAYGPDESNWPDPNMNEWVDIEEALVKLVAVLFAWNDTRNWTNKEYIGTI